MYKIKTFFKIYLVTVLIAIVTCVAINYFSHLSPKINIEPNNIYDESLIVVADQGFEPYSFIDDRGKISGHDIEMLYLIADEMEKNVEIYMLDWKDALYKINSGDADLALSVVYNPNKEHSMLYSSTVSEDKFTVFAKKDYHSIENLYNMDIAILSGSDVATVYLEPYNISASVWEYSSYKEAFESVENGVNDCVIATYSVGRQLSKNFPDIKSFGEPLISNAFVIGVSAGNEELLSEVNAAILELKKTGTLKRLNDKWLGQNVSIINTEDFIKKYLSTIIVVGTVIIIIPLFYVLFFFRKRSIVLKNEQFKLKERSSKDYLTEVYNRGAATNLVNKLLENADDDDKFYLFMIDIDNFKEINDEYGHLVGDRVLQTIANELRSIFTEKDILARYGGDEFFAFVYKEDSPNLAVDEIAYELCTRISQPNFIEDRLVKTSVSIGVASSKGSDDFTLFDLMEKADKALYLSKQNGKNQFSVYKK